MRRLVFTLAVAAIVVMAASVPASASYWFNLRINPSNWKWTQDPPVWSDLPYNGTIDMLGFTGFVRPQGMRFGLRFNFDKGSLNSWNCPSTGLPCDYDSGAWRWWDLSVGLPIMAGPVRLLPFLGYGRTYWQARLLGSPETEQGTHGFVYGADAWVPIGSSGRWYLTGNATLGSGQKWRYCNSFPCNDTLVIDGGTARSLGTANTWIYSAGLGWTPPSRMTSVELGWRTGGFDVASVTSGDTSAAGQRVRWEGWYFGLTVRR